MNKHGEQLVLATGAAIDPSGQSLLR